MGRIRSRATSAQPADLSAHSPTKQPPHKRKKKNGYKVVLESVTQKRKKLRLSATFDQNPPPGYTFVGFGDAKLTSQCKEFCRKRGELAYSVSAPPKNNATADPEKISFHVNRLGFYFPNKIVDLATEWLGITITGARPKSKNGSGFTQGLGRRLKAYVNLSEEDRVRAAMRDLFPKMPEESLEAIVEHAFAEGAKRVGNATNLTLERRVQMAVLAHVRHKHTDYDKLLKEVGYIQARKTVENPCIEKILTWRGENTSEDDDVVEMEDDFREIIVLDDSDDNDVEEDDEFDSESSVEYAPNPHVPVGRQYPGHPPTPSTHAPSAARPRSLIEPLSPQRFGYDGLFDRPVHRHTTYHQGTAYPRPAPRGYVQVPLERKQDPYVRLIPHKTQSLVHPHEMGGRHHFEVSHQQSTSRRVRENDPYGDAQLTRAARYDANSPHGQFVPRHHASDRTIVRESHGPYAMDRAEHVRHRSEPRPEDVVVPSIEKDEPGSANSSISIDPHAYISHQERSFLQMTSAQKHESLQARRRMEPVDDRNRGVPQENVIDLTDSPARGPKVARLGREQPAAIPAYNAARMPPSNHSIDERYYDRRPLGRAIDPKIKMVGENKPSLSLFLKLLEQIEGRQETVTARPSERLGSTGHGLNNREHTDIAGDTRSIARPPKRQNMSSTRSTFTSHVADKQIHEQPIPSKRRSGDFMAEEPAAHDGRPAYAVRRRIDDELPAPGRVLGTIDTTGPGNGPGGLIAADRLMRDPHAGRENFLVSSPTRMRLSHTYDDLRASEVPRQGVSSGIENQAVPRAHYYDYRPSNGDIRRHDDPAGAYR